MKTVNRFILFFVFIIPFVCNSQRLKPIVYDENYCHDKYETMPRDIVKEFRAYTVSFDGEDDDNKDGEPDFFRIPEWVSYEIKGMDDPGKSPKRPRIWIHDKELYKQGLCPKDKSYKYSRRFRNQHPNWYDRGHMCMKLIAWRHGANADWNTHTLLNACPQKADNNQGIWLKMEEKTIEYANKYGSVWVICGPIIQDKKPSLYIGESDKGEYKVAVPDAFFKIIVRDGLSQKKPEVLALIYPQDTDRKDDNHNKYLVSVDDIEEQTGLDFFTALKKKYQKKFEADVAKAIW